MSSMHAHSVFAAGLFFLPFDITCHSISYPYNTITNAPVVQTQYSSFLVKTMLQLLANPRFCRYNSTVETKMAKNGTGEPDFCLSASRGRCKRGRRPGIRIPREPQARRRYPAVGFAVFLTLQGAGAGGSISANLGWYRAVASLFRGAFFIGSGRNTEINPCRP